MERRRSYNLDNFSIFFCFHGIGIHFFRMKKIAILIVLLAILLTGCSYEVTAGNSQRLQGQNENWNVDYQIDFTTNYNPPNDNQVFAKQSDQNKIIVTYKKSLSDLAAVKHLEISYQDSFGGGGIYSEDFCLPPENKQFKMGIGGGGTTVQTDENLRSPENLHKYIMIYSGPDRETREHATATITIKLDDKTESIQLKPVKNPSQVSVLKEQIRKKLAKKAYLRFFSGHASDLSIKLEKADVRIATDQTASVPVLYYELTIKNEGRKAIIGNLNDLQVKIVPGDHLKQVSQETVGVDLFDPDFGYGSGESIEGSIFDLDKDCKIELSYDLSREGTSGAICAPSDKGLQKLLDNAKDASFIVTYKNEEAARIEILGEYGKIEE